MNVVTVEEFLARHPKVGIDTPAFIYWIEGYPKYEVLVKPVFEWLESFRGQAVTSTVTLLEVLVQPYRLQDTDRVNQFYALLSTFPHLDWVVPSLEIVDRAAQLRATHRLKTPDALQAATAVHCGATGFISNDPAFERIEGLEVLTLDSFLKRPKAARKRR